MKKKFQPTVEQWSVKDLVPYEGNAKIHTEDQITKLARQIHKTGWDVPIVVDEDGVIIKGHGRRLAAIHLKLKKVPVIVRRDLSSEDVVAARLADNRVAIGDFDTDLLQEELLKLSDIDYDLSSMGFEDKELDFLTDDPFGDMDDDAFGDPDEKMPTAEESVNVSISQALGFGKIHKTNVPPIKTFMAKIEADTGDVGESAFMKYVQSVMRQA